MPFGCELQYTMTPCTGLCQVFLAILSHCQRTLGARPFGCAPLQCTVYAGFACSDASLREGSRTPTDKHILRPQVPTRPPCFPVARGLPRPCMHSTEGIGKAQCTAVGRTQRAQHGRGALGAEGACTLDSRGCRHLLIHVVADTYGRARPEAPHASTGRLRERVATDFSTKINNIVGSIITVGYEGGDVVLGRGARFSSTALASGQSQGHARLEAMGSKR